MNATELQQATEATTTFKLLSTALKVAPFKDALPEYQLARIAEARSLIFGKNANRARSIQLISFLEVLASSDGLAEEVRGAIASLLHDWENPF